MKNVCPGAHVKRVRGGALAPSGATSTSLPCARASTGVIGVPSPMAKLTSPSGGCDASTKTRSVNSHAPSATTVARKASASRLAALFRRGGLECIAASLAALRRHGTPARVAPAVRFSAAGPWRARHTPPPALGSAQLPSGLHAHLRPRDLRVLPRFRREPAARWRDRRGCARGAFHAQEARCGLPVARGRVLPEDCGYPRGRRRLRRLL